MPFSKPRTQNGPTARMPTHEIAGDCIWIFGVAAINACSFIGEPTPGALLLSFTLIGRSKRMPSEELLIDADGHILEPPDLWEKYLEPRYRSRAVRIRVGADGFEFLEIDGRRAQLTSAALLASLGGMKKLRE